MLRIIMLLAFTVSVVLFSQHAFSAEVNLRSNDIRCSSCALTIKRAVSKIEGVNKVEVSAGEKTIHVEYDDSKVTENQIVTKIKSAGFKVEKPEKACLSC